MTPSEDLDARLGRIRDTLDVAESQMRRVRTRDSRAIVVGLVSGTLATVIAGVPGLTQQFILDGWQLTCAAAAGLTGVATLATGLRQQFGSSNQLVGAATVVAKLRALEFGLSVGRMSAEDADGEFQALIAQYPDLLPSGRLRRRPIAEG